MKARNRMLASALLLTGISLTVSGCIFVPVGGRYAYRPAVVAPVVAPAPVVVVRRPYPYWW